MNEDNNSMDLYFENYDAKKSSNSPMKFLASNITKNQRFDLFRDLGGQNGGRHSNRDVQISHLGH